MSHIELKQYVFEIISHQINDTIGNEEEEKHGEKCQIFWRTIRDDNSRNTNKI